MGIPYGVEYATQVTGGVWIPVTCEHCRLDFAYYLTRTGGGAETSYLGLTNARAKQRARAGAELSLEKQLEEGFDPFPCPDCGKYQEYMFRAAREQRTQNAKVLAYCGTVAALLIALVSPYLGSYTAARMGLRAALAMAGLAVVALIASRTLASRFEPNLDHAKRANRQISAEDRFLRRSEYESLVRFADDAAREQLPNISWKGATNVARVARVA